MENLKFSMAFGSVQSPIPTDQTKTRTDVSFLQVEKFKSEFGCRSIRVLRNPHTGKLFCACDTGENLKCQGDLDPSKPMSFLIPKGGSLEDACLVNVKNEGAPLIVEL